MHFPAFWLVEKFNLFLDETKTSELASVAQSDEHLIGDQ